MRLFQCQVCDSILHFENRSCERCGYKLAYLPEAGTLSALRPTEDTAWVALAMPHRPSRFCANADYDACNWLVPQVLSKHTASPAGTTALSRTSQIPPSYWLGSRSKLPNTGCSTPFCTGTCRSRPVPKIPSMGCCLTSWPTRLKPPAPRC